MSNNPISYFKLKRLVLDGFANLIIGMGFGSKDKARSFSFNPRDRFDYMTLDFIYAQIGIVKKIVNIFADDMTREGIDFLCHDSDKFIEQYKKLNIWHNVNKALKHAVLHGSGACIMLINDGREYNEPLDYNNIKSIDDIITVDKHYLQPLDGFLAFKKIDIWNVGIQNQIIPIHESRILFFDGEDCGERLRASNNGSGESFIWCVWEAIENYFICHNTIPNLLIEQSQGVYKIKGLNAAFANKNKNMQDELINRVSIISNMKSMNNLMCIDSEEGYDRVNIPLANVTDVVSASERRLCAEVDIPHSRLLQESAGASLGESGNSQKRDHYDNIKAKQEMKLRPNLVKLNKILSSLLKTKEPEFIFNSLWQMSEKEQAEIMAIIASVDVIYKDMGMPIEDILKSHFGDKKYSSSIFWSGVINQIITQGKNTSKPEKTGGKVA